MVLYCFALLRVAGVAIGLGVGLTRIAEQNQAARHFDSTWKHVGSEITHAKIDS